MFLVAASKIISPAVGFCGNRFYSIYFEALSASYPASPGAVLRVIRADEPSITSWTSYATLGSAQFAESGSISEMLCVNQTTMAVAVRFGPASQATSIGVYLIDLVNPNATILASVAGGVYARSDLWAGLSLARVSDWLVVKYSAQDSSFKWKNFYSFASAVSPSLWSAPMAVETPSSLNQSSIQGSLACNGIRCISPYTRLLNHRGSDPVLQNAPFWQTFSLSPSCNASDVGCFSGLGCDVSSCSCMDQYETDPARPGQCRPLCGNGRVDPHEQCEGGAGCNMTTCTCSVDRGFISISSVCVETCKITPFGDPCAGSRPYRCGDCCSVTPCQTLTKQCPEATCHNGTCSSFKSVLPTCSAGCTSPNSITCANGLCVPSLDKCEPVTACPFLQARSDGCCGGSCGFSACPLGTERCADGQCRSNCIGLRMFGCPSTEVLCPTGHCRGNINNCPGGTSDRYTCHNGVEGTMQTCRRVRSKRLMLFHRF